MIVPNKTELSRRAFIRYAIFSGLMCLTPGLAWSARYSAGMPDKSLSLFNPNTKESLFTTYWSDGQYVPQALAEINHIMRDRLTGDIKPIDVRLLDLLHAIGTELKNQRPLHVISGYRSLKNNTLLRRRGKPASKNSYHLRGKAADICIPGCQLSALRGVSAQLKGGGVGYYPQAGFLHVDVGPIRYWSVR
jgi:uncharacterized protein YcbK (DUF882 family)